jgi:thioredoxin reductase
MRTNGSCSESGAGSQPVALLEILTGRVALDLDNVIVGAGPYGLSIAAHLRAAGTPFTMFGEPLESWRRSMPRGMLLKSERFASNLWDPRRRFSLARYCNTRSISYQPVGDPLEIELFLDYAEWFRHNAAGESQDVKVTEIRRAPKGFALQLADGRTMTSRRVVLATGHMKFRIVPPEIAHLSEPQVAHSTRIGELQNYVGRDITIIGAGQSALETAALLNEAGAQVRVLVRRQRVEWNAQSKPRPLVQRILKPDAGVGSGWKSLAVSEFPRTFRWRFAPAKRHRFLAGSYGPSGSWWLKDRINGKVAIWLDSKIETANLQGEQVHLHVSRSGIRQEILTDNVIASTGFQTNIDRLDYLDSALRESILREAGGIPALSSHFETSVPGLFVVGIASSPVFGPIMRFMYGAKHAAPIVAARLRS